MGVRDCLISAAEQGAITREEAEQLNADFEEKFAQSRLSMGDAPARAKAKLDLEAALRAEAIEKRRRADLTEAARLSLKQRLLENKDGAFNWAKSILSHYGFRDGSSVRGRTEAIIGLAHAQMSDALFAFRRSGVLGRRENRAIMPDFVKELHGENSGDATAKALAEAVSDVNEDLRMRFNAAGGAIGKLDGWGLAHKWDRAKVKAMRRDPWKQAMRGRLDMARMTDALTGQPISAARFEAALDHAFENIVSDGRAHMQPQMRPFGLGPIAARRADERFFVFKDASAWLEMHEMAGQGDVVQAVVSHVNGMARDIAAMEVLGPNPAAMVEWMKQVVAREYGRLDAGMPSLAQPLAGLGLSGGRAAEAYVGWLWETMRGAGTVVSGAASLTSSVKNLTTSATLGTTGILAAATDPFVAMAARRLGGLPVVKNFGGVLRMIRRSSRDDIIRSGVIWDEYLHVMADDMRFAGPMLGAEWTRWLADRAVTWNGLKPLTTGRKLVEARAWQEHIADLARAGTSFDSLDPRFKAALDGFGVTRDDWAIWSAAIDHNGFVTPAEIARRGGSVSYLDINQVPMTDPARLAEEKALRHRQAAEKLAELTTSWSERSVPSGTPNARAVLSAGKQRGTIPGELMEYFLQFKSFGLSFTSLQLEAMGQMGGFRSKSGLGYLAALVIPMTIGGMAYIAIKHLLNGEDPEDMTDPAFAGKALLTGGGFGLFGDFVKASENRFGQSMLEALQGPGVAYLSDTMQLMYGMAAAAMQAEDQNPGRRASQYLGRWTPVVSSHPATRAAWQRVVLDNLQWATDPKADKSFKAKAARAKANGAPYFLPPGTLTPSRAAPKRRVPDFGNAIGR